MARNGNGKNGNTANAANGSPEIGKVTPVAWQPPADWQPAVTLDLFESDARDFHLKREAFLDWVKSQPRDTSLVLPDGWHEITPAMAEELLKRNTRNRPVDFNYVLAYGTQMVNNRWLKTGEPVIINSNGDVDDAGHRLWACYFSRVSFTTYVVNVPFHPDLFAFIDNGRSRSGADALTTAGIGEGKLLNGIIKTIALPYDDGTLSYNGRLQHAPVTNIEIYDYVRANPGMDDSIREVLDHHGPAIKLIGNKRVACFVGWKILSLYDSTVLEEFFGSLVENNLPVSHPVAVLQKRLDEHEGGRIAGPRSPKRKSVLTTVQILALVIRAFNLSQQGLSVKRIDPRGDDPFPEFEIADAARAAA